jgi:hypothetical protein
LKREANERIAASAGVSVKNAASAGEIAVRREEIATAATTTAATTATMTAATTATTTAATTATPAERNAIGIAEAMIAKESGYKTADKTVDKTATEGQTTVQTTVEMTATGAMEAMQVLPVNPAISS